MTSYHSAEPDWDTMAPVRPAQVPTTVRCYALNMFARAGLSVKPAEIEWRKSESHPPLYAAKHGELLAGWRSPKVRRSLVLEPEPESPTC